MDTPKFSLLERLSVKLSRINENPTFKTFQHWYCTKIMSRLFMLPFKRRVYVDNIDWLIPLNPQRGVIWAGNHRSFFDLGVVTAAFVLRKITWPRRTTFPVRTDFFYNHPLGLIMNYLVGAGIMYPPIFRDPKKSDWNQDALQRIIHFLSLPGSNLGFHPEGTRSKEPDPYTLLPAKPGIGQIIFHAKPIVIPFFMNGLENGVWNSFKETRKKDARRSSPIVLTFGKPIEYDEFTNQEPGHMLYKEISNHVLNEIRALIPREKEIRSLCKTGKISDNDTGWVI